MDWLPILGLILYFIGLFSGWMIAPYFDKVVEWRKKRIKKEVNQCLA